MDTYCAINRPEWAIPWNYGPIPLHNMMDTYCAINRPEWAIPWNYGPIPLHNMMDTYCAINRPEWAIPWNYGPIPLHNMMDTYCAINRPEWAIPCGVLQFKKGPRPPPPSLPCMCSTSQTRVYRAWCAGQTGRGTSPGPSSQIDRPALGVETFQARCGSFRDLVFVSYRSKSKTLQNPRHK
jgi:hypothetical protein